MPDKKKSPNEAVDAQLARHERIVAAAATLSESEKAELRDWERAHVTGAGRFKTSDWPGWNAIINRISH